jgi:hypothetical protein
MYSPRSPGGTDYDPPSPKQSWFTGLFNWKQLVRPRPLWLILVLTPLSPELLAHVDRDCVRDQAYMSQAAGEERCFCRRRERRRTRYSQVSRQRAIWCAPFSFPDCNAY